MLVYSFKMIDRKTRCRCVCALYSEVRRHDEHGYCNGGSIFCLRNISNCLSVHSEARAIQKHFDWRSVLLLSRILSYFFIWIYKWRALFHFNISLNATGLIFV